jgi:PIN domain nuclease of toxin-antitoxin system
MRYLLDTQIWLWSLVSPDRMGEQVSRIVDNPDNTLVLSAASTWEISIKYRLGKLPLPEPPEEFILPRLTRDGIESLPIHHHHAARVATLPDYHRDPFDRLLVAIAQTESMTILTSDPKLQHYDVNIIL